MDFPDALPDDGAPPRPRTAELPPHLRPRPTPPPAAGPPERNLLEAIGDLYTEQCKTRVAAQTCAAILTLCLLVALAVLSIIGVVLFWPADPLA